MNRLRHLTMRDWIGLALVCAGFILRLRQFLVNRSLWLDEAMLTNNILARDFGELFLQLDNNQGAPIGFLLLQKTITLTLGDSEYALRLFPFLAGCLSLTWMFLLARKVASPCAGSLALALFALSPALVSYSSEAKQYSSDVAIMLGLCLFYLKYEQADLKPINAVFLSLAGGLAVWLSHPALFVIGSLGLALFLPALRAKDKRRIVMLILVAAAWGLNLGVLYFVNLRQLSTHQFFLDFWVDGFLPHDVSALAWLGNFLHAPFADLLGLRTYYIVNLSLFFLGLFGLTRRLPRFGLFLIQIFFLTLSASFLTLYPFAGRMILFLAPALTLLLADGVELIASLISRPRWLAWMLHLALAGFLLFSPLDLAAENFNAPKMREHIRPTMEYLRDHLKEGDVVYVYYWAEHAVGFYAPKYGMNMSNFIIGMDHHTDPAAYRAELDALRGRARVWFLFLHVYESGDFNERDFILDYLDSIGHGSREYRVPGTSVYLYLYDLR